MQRLTRIIPPIQRTTRPFRSALIPHAGPSTLPSLRLLSSAPIRSDAPFSALKRPQRYDRLPTSPLYPNGLPSSGTLRNTDAEPEGDVERYEVEVDAAGSSSTRTASAAASSSSGRSAAEAEADEALAEVDQAELYGVEEDVDVDVEEVTIARNLYLDEKNIDAALKPFQQPQIPRQIQPGEPILLPLSNLGAPDPTAPSSSGVAVSLPPNIFNALVRKDILHTCAVWYRASMRRGTHRTLGRSEVAFSGRKIRPQKKTGKARLGHRGSPMLKKGGHAHPIRPRDYSYHLPRKIRALGMRMALSSKLYMNNLRVVESLNEAGWTATYQAARALTSGKRIAAEYADTYGYNGDVERQVARAQRAEKAMSPYKRAVLLRQRRQVAAAAAADEGLLEEEEAADAEEATLKAKEASAGEEGAEPLEEKVEAEAAAEAEAEAEAETEADAEPQLSLEDITIKSPGFGGRNDLSILFLYPPTKPAREIWDFARVVRNIPGVEIISTDDVEVYHILKFKWLVMEGGAIDSIATHAGQLAPQLPDLRASLASTATDTPLPAAIKTKRKVKRPASDAAGAAPARIPRLWVLDKWRKARGAKSLIKTFGLRNANIQKLLAKRAWNKIRKEGRRATPDGVAAEIAKRKVGGVKALGRIEPQIGGSAGF